ncbi:MAG TPA: glycosyltransferase family 1 protein [Solirubrobacteraceae bacterium]|nr:glycosyltransferase family 1 protein [Solirubrobacteraceae bacterium]
MRVLIDTTFERRGPSGTGVYIRSLIDALRAAGVEVLEAANQRRPPPAGGGPGSARNLLGDRWWTEFALPRHARRLGADVLHHPLPAHARRAGCPQMVTVHDLAFEVWPDLFAPRFRVWARRAHRVASQRAQAVVCVSHATAGDVLRRWGIPESRIVVAHHGPGQFGRDTEQSASRTETAAWTGAARHLLYVGDDEPRKNVGLLIEAYRRYVERRSSALPLVLAGGAQRPDAGAQSGPRAGPDAGIQVETHPDRDRLARLYADAAALVHPSRHEGFGLTLVEAMHLGVPVVTAASAATREVCGDAARYVDAGDAEGLAGELDRLTDDERLRRDLSRRGLARAAQFSWERSARAHIEAYTLALR